MATESNEAGAKFLPLPQRCIFDDTDLKCFMESPTKVELMNFVEAMGKSCASTEGLVDDHDYSISSHSFENIPPSMACLHGSLQEMVSWVDDFPPVSSNTAAGIRFGNPAFRSWHARLVERSGAIITTILQARDDDGHLTVELACQRGKDSAAGVLNPNGGDRSVRQVSLYLQKSFGDSARLDYGTGHESFFAIFLLILSKVKCFGEPPFSMVTLRAVTLSIFDQYLKVTRRYVPLRREP